MKQTDVLRVDLARIDGGGEFSCPRCGATIAPDDDSEDAYTILDSKVNNNDLEEIVIRCNKCSSRIHLTGFSLLRDLSNMDEKCLGERKTKPFLYVTHD